MSERSFDVVVIGAGPAGEVVRGPPGRRAASRSRSSRSTSSAASAPSTRCMPSKALLRPARCSPRRGASPARPRRSTALDVPAVLERRDEVIHHLDDDNADSRGSTPAASRSCAATDGSPASAPSQVGDETLTARRAVVIATGTDAADTADPRACARRARGPTARR